MSDISTLDTIDRDELHDHLLDEIEDRFNVLIDFIKLFHNYTNPSKELSYHIHYLKDDMKDNIHMDYEYLSNDEIRTLYASIFKE